MSQPMRKVESWDELQAAEEAGERGVFMFSDREGQRRGGIIVTLPQGTGATIAHLPIRLASEPGLPGTWWEWNGDEDAPTLTPSVWHDKPGGWHGFIRAGELVPA